MADLPNESILPPSALVPGGIKISIKEIDDKTIAPGGGGAVDSLVLSLTGIEVNLLDLSQTSRDHLRALASSFTSARAKSVFENYISTLGVDYLFSYDSTNKVLEVSSSLRSLVAKEVNLRKSRYINCKMYIRNGRRNAVATNLYITSDDSEKSTTSKTAIADLKSLSATTKLLIST